MGKYDLSDYFSFPFPPYDIQHQFMKALFTALDERKLGIFESPTGTGKSLSIICGALTWLEHQERTQKESLRKVVEENSKETDTEDWFNAASKRIEKENEKRKAKKDLNKIEKQENRIKNLRLKKQVVKQKLLDIKKADDEFKVLFPEAEKDNKPIGSDFETELSLLENEFLLEDYKSDNEESADEGDSEEEDDGCLKIFYCSRTHSQLSQFVREIQKTRFKSDARVATLASRQNLCINPDVLKLGSLSLVNERCLDLQTAKKGVATESDSNQPIKRKKTSTGCPFNKQTNIQNLSDQVLLEVQDIEQLVDLGRKSKTCPYYSSRKSIKDSQLVVLPYNTLLHKSTREACKIKLKNNIVIVDEAHNLLETIGNIHSVMLSYNQVCCAHSQLSEYMSRYERKFTPKNLLYIKQILFLVKAFMKILSPESINVGSVPSNLSEKSRLFSLQDFLYETMIFNLNLFKIIQYMERSKIAHKLHKYKTCVDGQIKTHSKDTEAAEKVTTSSFLAKMAAAKSSQTKKAKEPVKVTHTPAEIQPKEEVTSVGTPLLGVIEFLKAVTCGSSDGRIVVNTCKEMKKCYMNYLLLNPASQFHDIVKECRSVIVAGGTMAPMDEFKTQLFLSAGACPSRLQEFSCSHVVPSENVLPLVLKRGPGSVTMDFTFKSRKEPNLLDELGRTLTNFCNVIPGGVVCFFPSYDFEQIVNEHFSRTKVIDRITKKKKVFREPKKSSELDKVLSDFSNAVQKGDKNGLRGALLFSVVGGKMSEGINFSDDLGRCVIMVGMPYPNSTSVVLKEKMAYLNKHFPVHSDGRTAGAVYYENLCFKAVNQSIGRSIRHKNDYASILLLDQRYASESSRSHLPSWISSRVTVCEQFGQAFSSIRKFFADKKQ